MDELPRMTCPACGYDLRTLSSGPCPECGREFDPADPRTYIGPLPDWLPDHDRESVAALNWFAASVALVALVGDAVVVPTDLACGALLLIPAVSAAVGSSLVRAVAGALLLRRRGASAVEQLRLAFGRLRGAVAAFIISLLVVYPGGVWLRVWLSTPWLVPAARAASNAGPGTCDAESRWLGLIPMYSINSDGGGALVYVRRGNSLWAIRCDVKGWPVGWWSRP